MDLFDKDANSIPISFKSYEPRSISWSDPDGGFEISLHDGELFFSEHFFTRKVSDRCVTYFQETVGTGLDGIASDTAVIDGKRFRNINWTQDHIKLYGKTIPLPRLTSWYGDSGRAYTYSGITSKPNEWNDGLLYLKERIEGCANTSFNSVLLNWYRNGEDYINWHCDDEKELGTNPIVASANFGATRDFVLRRKDDKAKKLVIPLRHGTLLIMRGALQHYWEHSVPKRKRVGESRFNLTFRQISMDG